MPTRVVSAELVQELPPKSRTFSALRHSAFRLFFFGQLVSVTGTWMQIIAQQIVVYNITGSKSDLGLVACVQGLPVLLLMPFAGVFVERVARRKILVGTQTLMMILAFIMAALNFAGVMQLWHIVLLSFGLGIANALDAPARLSFFVEMVGREDLSSSIILNSTMFNAARVLGPALGGLALSGIGSSWCFLLNGLSFLAVIFSLVIMRVIPLPSQRTQGRITQQIKEGVRFARHHDIIGPLLILSVVTSTFANNFSVLVPPFADKILHDTEIGTSAMYTAQGIGSLLATVFIAYANERRIRGKTLFLGAILGPVALIALCAVTDYAAVLPLVGVAGFALVCQYVMMNTLIQTNVPDEFRGRILSLYTLTFFGLSPFGSLFLGYMAELIDTVPTLFLCAVITLIGAALIVRRAPQLGKLP
jgi:MFS family permease